MTRRRARLSEEDRAIWERVARSTTPLATRPLPVAVEAAPAQRASVRLPAPERAPPMPAKLPAKLPVLAPQPKVLKPQGRALPPSAWSLTRSAPAPVGRPEPGIDRRTAERLRRGEREPDARLDLHGMSAERAHARLDRFIAEAHQRGARCVLVITGKGGRRRSDEDAPYMTPERGILRDAAPRWLRHGPLNAQIVGIYEAHARHGGGGAFYVYLKKRR